MTQPDGEFSERNASIQDVLHWFDDEHLTEPNARAVASNFKEFVHFLAKHLPNDGPQLYSGLNDLLRAKDALARHAVATGWKTE